MSVFWFGSMFTMLAYLMKIQYSDVSSSLLFWHKPYLYSEISEIEHINLSWKRQELT